MGLLAISYRVVDGQEAHDVVAVEAVAVAEVEGVDDDVDAAAAANAACSGASKSDDGFPVKPRNLGQAGSRD